MSLFLYAHFIGKVIYLFTNEKFNENKMDKYCSKALLIHDEKRM